MSKTATNLIVILGLITVAYAGYYLYTQQAGSSLDLSSSGSQTTQDMLNNTQVFIGYGQTLQSVKLDLGFFEDERFRSLHTFRTKIEERPVGRSNPFAEPAVGNGTF